LRKVWFATGFAIVAALPCAAQTAGSIAVNAGTATDVTGVGSSALTIAPSLTRASGSSSTTLGASATKFANDAWSAGFAAALSGRASTRIVTPVIDLSLTGATTSYDFSYASADLVPSLEVNAGRAKFFGGARLSAAGTSEAMPTPLGPIPGETRSATSRTATTAVGGVSFSALTSGNVASVGYRLETGVVAGASQTDHGISGSIAGSRMMLAAVVGRRARAGTVATFGSATFGIAVMPSVMLQFSAGSYPSNPMFGTAAGRFVNAGLSMRLGRRAGSMPAPSGVRPPAAGRTRVSIRASDARRVELAGDFNQWKPVTATRADNGVWFVDLDLAPGEYRYAFRIDGKEWRVPAGVAAVDDEFGGKSAWLTVSQPASTVSR
jgi:hypothetical protein